jgi:hypothetical protein
MKEQQGMGAPPFAGGQRPGGARQAAKAENTRPPFECQVPEGWIAAAAGAMQLAAYQVRDGNQEAAVTVSTAGGELAANVNRWRGQVQLAPLDPAKLQAELHMIKVDGHDAAYAEAIGPESANPRETILGVVVEAQGKQWFIKLKGDAELAAREKPRFEKFVQSIRFRGK